MRERVRCIGCGRLSPETDTNYTLISSQFGWRLTRFRREDGEFIVEWRCPTCWKVFKDGKRAAEEAAFTSSFPPPRQTPTPQMPQAPQMPGRSPSQAPPGGRTSPPPGGARPSAPPRAPTSPPVWPPPQPPPRKR